MEELSIFYYVDWKDLEPFDYLYDKNGIPLVDYGDSIGLKYNAITVAQWGLNCLSTWELTGNRDYRKKAMSCAQWLVSHAKPWENGALAWIYDYGFDLYGPQPPWISAMAQGEALSLLLRCHQIRSRDVFLDVSHQAAKVFLFHFSEGGVMDTLSDGSLFPQEYPTIPPVHVLNGGIFALYGLYDYVKLFQERDYQEVMNSCIQGLLTQWREWDTGYWSRYDLFQPHRLASKMYHKLHVRQFRVLAKLFDPEFNRIADRWEQMQENSLCRTRWILGKIAEKGRLQWFKMKRKS